MSNPIVRIHNTQTNEVVDREMTVAELKTYEAEQKLAAERKVQAETKANAKAALLGRLGITEDEAKLLLS